MLVYTFTQLLFGAGGLYSNRRTHSLAHSVSFWMMLNGRTAELRSFVCLKVNRVVNELGAQPETNVCEQFQLQSYKRVP